MPVNWKKEYQPEKIIKNIEDSRKIGDDGKVQFEGFGFKEFEVLLYSMLDFNEDVPEIDARHMITNAIFKAGAKGVISTKSLFTEVSRLEREYQDSPIHRYALLTSISINQLSRLKRIRMGDRLIIFERISPTKFCVEAEYIINEAKNSLFASMPTDYLQVRVHLYAKSVCDAADKALDTIDYVRGTWNWSINLKLYTRESWGGKPKPVNQIILGPVHTLHKPTGQLAATNQWWYEPSYLGSIKPFYPKRDEVDTLYKTFSRINRKLKKHKYPDVIKNAFIRYARALDERDWTTAFIKLWGILELLTDTIGLNYDATVRRTAFIFQDRDYYMQVMEHLRRYRNSSIHHDVQNSMIETILFQLKYCVDALIGFHINNKQHFKSIEEAGAFLNLPFEAKIIDSQLKKLKFAKKIRGLQ